MLVVYLAPNLVYELTMRSYLSLSLCQALEQRVLGSRQAQRFACRFNPPAHRIYSKLPIPQNRHRLLSVSAPQKRANAGEEFSISERFRKIVIRACVEHSDLLGFLTTYRENQDWALIEFADLCDNS